MPVYVWVLLLMGAVAMGIAMIRRSFLASHTVLPPAFSPSDLSGLTLWLKSDAGVITTIGNAVDTWNDQSGNSNTVIQGTQANQPTKTASDAVFGGKPSIVFDGVNDLMATAGTLTYDQFTVFIVAQATSNGELYSRETFDEIYTSNGTATFVCRNATVTSPYAAHDLPANWGLSASAKTYVHRFGGTNASDILRVNGVQQAMTNASSGTVATGAIAKRFVLGGRLNATMAFGGKMAEVIVYNRALSDLEAASVEGYLRTRYAHY